MPSILDLEETDTEQSIENKQSRQKKTIANDDILDLKDKLLSRDQPHNQNCGCGLCGGSQAISTCPDGCTCSKHNNAFDGVTEKFDSDLDFMSELSEIDLQAISQTGIHNDNCQCGTCNNETGHICGPDCDHNNPFAGVMEKMDDDFAGELKELEAQNFDSIIAEAESIINQSNTQRDLPESTLQENNSRTNDEPVEKSQDKNNPDSNLQINRDASAVPEQATRVILEEKILPISNPQNNEMTLEPKLTQEIETFAKALDAKQEQTTERLKAEIPIESTIIEKIVTEITVVNQSILEDRKILETNTRVEFSAEVLEAPPKDNQRNRTMEIPEQQETKIETIISQSEGEIETSNSLVTKIIETQINPSSAAEVSQEQQTNKTLNLSEQGQIKIEALDSSSANITEIQVSPNSAVEATQEQQINNTLNSIASLSEKSTKDIQNYEIDTLDVSDKKFIFQDVTDEKLEIKDSDEMEIASKALKEDITISGIDSEIKLNAETPIVENKDLKALNNIQSLTEIIESETALTQKQLNFLSDLDNLENISQEDIKILLKDLLVSEVLEKQNSNISELIEKKLSNFINVENLTSTIYSLPQESIESLTKLIKDKEVNLSELIEVLKNFETNQDLPEAIIKNESILTNLIENLSKLENSENINQEDIKTLLKDLLVAELLENSNIPTNIVEISNDMNLTTGKVENLISKIDSLPQESIESLTKLIKNKEVNLSELIEVLKNFETNQALPKAKVDLVISEILVKIDTYKNADLLPAEINLESSEHLETKNKLLKLLLKDNSKININEILKNPEIVKYNKQIEVLIDILTRNLDLSPIEKKLVASKLQNNIYYLLLNKNNLANDKKIILTILLNLMQFYAKINKDNIEEGLEDLLEEIIEIKELNGQKIKIKKKVKKPVNFKFNKSQKNAIDYLIGIKNE